MRRMELWHVPLAIGADRARQAMQLLDEAEVARARRFRRAVHAQAFIAAHSALRGIIGRRLGLSPRALRFETAAGGKPALAPRQGGGLEFNLSHSGACGVIALAQGTPVGVDIETFEAAAAPLQDPDSLGAVLSPAELHAIDACPAAGRPLARLRCWVRKEAVLKGAGCGLSDDVRKISVSIGPEARVIASTHPQVRMGEWSLSAFEQPGRWSGAVAMRGPLQPVAVHYWSWAA